MTNDKRNMNQMWKLDLLETKFLGLRARYLRTTKLLGAHNNAKLMKRISMSKEDAIKEIKALKEEIFNKKHHGSYHKLSKEVKKYLKGEMQKRKHENRALLDFFESEERIECLVRSKLVKLVSMSLLACKDSQECFLDYIPDDILDAMKNKENKYNPSGFFITNCRENPTLNSFISAMWNKKPIKLLLGEIEWSYKLLRGNLSKNEKRAHKENSKDGSNENVPSSRKEDSEKFENRPASHPKPDESNGRMDGPEKPFEGKGLMENIKSSIDTDSEKEFDDMEKYDDLVAEFESEPEVLEPEHDNYNSTETKLGNLSSKIELQSNDNADKRLNLPQFATGYFSGGSDTEDELSDDDMVKEATTVRKNRRGQRARQKIWEKKYGKNAKHVQKELVREDNEKLRRRLEYEERCRKRAIKAAMDTVSSKTSLNKLTSNNKYNSSTKANANSKVSEKLHPSWEAKKIAEEKQREMKFTGKKIKFD